MARLVLQSEAKGKVKVWHLAIMQEGSIGEHAYPKWRDHRNMATYLCSGPPTHDYQSWDNLTDGPLDRIVQRTSVDIVAEQLCAECLGIVKGETE